MKGIFLLLGSNLGDRLANLHQAQTLLGSSEMTVVDYSSVYESAPWGNSAQGWFLNLVLRVDTIHDPHQLLYNCLATEKQMGRVRTKRWGERIIDIDLLYYDNYTLETDDLVLPHPGIALRRFTLLPLAEIAPGEIHPVLNRSQKDLLEICPDQLECRLTDLTFAL